MVGLCKHSPRRALGRETGDCRSGQGLANPFNNTLENYGRGLKRGIRQFTTLALVCLAQVGYAHASLHCYRIQRLPTAFDSRTADLLDNYAKMASPSRPLQFGKFDDRFVFAHPADEDCQLKPCYYRFLDIRDEKVNERFSFLGTGVVFVFASSGRNDDYLKGRFYTIALETSPVEVSPGTTSRTHISVDLPFGPSGGNTILVGASPGWLSTCGPNAGTRTE
jgi:hypothetical protein